MRHNSPFPWLLSAALLLLFAKTAAAQLGAQITANSAGAKPSLAGNNQDRLDAASAMHGPGLTMVPEDFAKLTLAPGFLLDLNVLDDPDLVGSFRVDQQGDLALPVLGTLHVANETVSEARLQIQKKLLDDQILKDPQVNLSVQEYTAPEVTIVGEVASPGKYPLLAPRALTDVLALAGGTTLTAGDQVEIVRAGANAAPVLVHYSSATDQKALANAMVDPGDTVQVKRAGIVYVLGAVNRPGGYVMQEEGTLNVLQALALANGTALAAKTGEIHVLRRDDQGTVADIRLSYKKLTRGQSPEVELHAQDVLYVPVNKLKAALTNGSSILAGATSASIYAVH
jgi:polysaccharide export outer membrane protein